MDDNQSVVTSRLNKNAVDHTLLTSTDNDGNSQSSSDFDVKQPQLRDPFDTETLLQANSEYSDKTRTTFTQDVKLYLYTAYGLHDSVWENLSYFIPILRLVGRRYSISDFLRDFITGLTLAALLIPQSLAYAPLTGLPAQYGLYSGLIGGAVYLFVGPTTLLSSGPFAISSILVSSAIATMHPELLIFEQTNPVEGLHLRLVYTMTLTFVTAICLYIMAFFRLGWIIDLVSAPAMSAFIMGASFTICATQLGAVLGIKTVGGTLLKTIISIIKNIQDTNFASLLMGVTVAIIVVICETYGKRKKLKIPLPAQLSLVVLATVITGVFQLDKNFDIKILGEIEMGYPKAVLPDFSLINLDYILNGVICSVVCFVVGSSINQYVAEITHIQPQYNLELFALATVNLVSCVTNAYVGSSALSRTVVVNACNPSTILWNLWTSLSMMTVIWFLGGYLYYLPKCVLGGLLIASFRGQFYKLAHIPKYFIQAPIDGLVHIATLLSTACFGPQTGVVVAYVSSILQIIANQSNKKFFFLRNIYRTQRWVRYDCIPMNDYYQYLETTYFRNWTIPKKYLNTSVDDDVNDELQLSPQNAYREEDIGNVQLAMTSSAYVAFHSPDSSNGTNRPQILSENEYTSLQDPLSLASNSKPEEHEHNEISPECRTFDDNPNIVAIHVGCDITFVNHNSFCEFLEGFIRVHTQWLTTNKHRLQNMLHNTKLYAPEYLRQEMNQNSSNENNICQDISILQNIPSCGDKFTSSDEKCMEAEMIKSVLNNHTDETIQLWKMCIVLDNITLLDLSARSSLSHIIKNNPSILFLFSRPHHHLLQYIEVYSAPTSYYIDNLYVAMDFAEKIINIAQACRDVNNITSVKPQNNDSLSSPFEVGDDDNNDD